MYPWRTYSRTFQGILATGLCCMLLVDKSQWFAVMPLPHDIYEITVKEENTALLDRICNTSTPGGSRLNG